MLPRKRNPNKKVFMSLTALIARHGTRSSVLLCAAGAKCWRLCSMATRALVFGYRTPIRYSICISKPSRPFPSICFTSGPLLTQSVLPGPVNSIFTHPRGPGIESKSKISDNSIESRETLQIRTSSATLWNPVLAVGTTWTTLRVGGYALKSASFKGRPRATGV